MLTVLMVTLITTLINQLTGDNVFDLIETFVLAPLTQSFESLLFGLVIVFLTHLLWAFGIHGSNIFEGLLKLQNVNAISQNQALLVSGVTGGFVIFNKSFADVFGYMGGSGVGSGLVIALLLVSKSKQSRMVGYFGLALGLFNINEPMSSACQLF